MASSLLDPNETFASLSESIGLDNRLRKAVQRLGHVRPTLVQSKCLPLAITSGRDLLVRATTGSGKTLAYCLPLLQKILHNKEVSDASNRNHPSGVRAVVLVPTRELCSQVHKTLQSLIYYCDDVVSVAVLTSARSSSGGNGDDRKKAQQELTRQKAMLRDRPDVIVATPAGLLTHIRNGDVQLKESMDTLVVDEADLVLSFGAFEEIEIQHLCEAKEGRIYLFSHNFTRPPYRLFRRYIGNHKVHAKDSSGISNVSYSLRRTQFFEKGGSAFACCSEIGTRRP